MNYDYKIINTDPTTAFVKRSLLYVAILTVTVSLALIILFVLFERYLMLIVPGALILLSALAMFLIGRQAGVIEYHFTNDALEVVFGRDIKKFTLSDLTVERNAENSDFFDKTITKLSFIKNRIVFKNAINDNTVTVKNRVITDQTERFIVALDDYALALLGGCKNEQ